LLLAQLCERKFGGNPPRRGRGVPRLLQIFGIYKDFTKKIKFICIFSEKSLKCLIFTHLLITLSSPWQYLVNC